ncbi:hypothetical protein PDJAM_G00069450 [Pangasius djambal]|uniref:Uncharacterized protein n=1 Tax=Pangasius djambal TaxID=1691987 RepID=A0ACC5YZN5_9TELE|nr:hypothetical protein [Pangasius djambal]
MGFRKKNKSPPVLSHEFVIQNHADMVSCVAMIILLGLMFEQDDAPRLTVKIVQERSEEHDKEFKVLTWPPDSPDLNPIEHLWDVLDKQEEFVTNPTFLWEGYPHTRMAFQVKFFYICQMAYWFHALPELYFQKVRKEDIPRQLYYISLYIFHITGAYVLNLHRLGLVLLVPHYLVELLFHASRLFYFSNENKQKGFTLWALLFVIARLLTLTLSVLTFGFGLSRTDNQGFSLAEGNFNVLTVRMTCLSAICLTQAWMMWKFINFQLKKWREQSQVQSSKKKTVSPKSKPGKKDSSRGGSVNGVMKAEDKTSPRARKSKTS